MSTPINKIRNAAMLQSIANEVKRVEDNNEGIVLSGIILHFAVGVKGDKQMLNMVIGMDRLKTIGLCEIMRVQSLTNRHGDTDGPSEKGDE